MLKIGYKKRKGASKLVTGKESGPQNQLQKKNWGPKIGYRKRKWASNMVTEGKKRASNMVTEINWGLKYGYGNKLGPQKCLQKNLFP